MTFDPSTCIHCDPTGESLGAVMAIWILWLAPGLLFVLRRRITAVGWLASAASGLVTAAGVLCTVVAVLISIAWLISTPLKEWLSRPISRSFQSETPGATRTSS